MKKWIEVSPYTGIEEDAPTNAVGGGSVAGLGVGPMGEPGVHRRKKKKKETLIDGRTKAYREHRKKLEVARVKRMETKKGRGKFTADEWLDHITSTRKQNFTVFGKPASRTVREPKRFKYDSGPFRGKEVVINKEELFDSNLAIFNESGDLTGGLLYAAKKFGLQLDANELGAMLKLNPLNRVRPIELGLPKGAQETFNTAAQAVIFLIMISFYFPLLISMHF